ncbi:transmembrane protein 39A isoform X2 [Aplysia californica]|uniref:Transmembrane protein 39A isoform X2 n=1 Tax=Aplysia californica TaxID=6500 RepID=A0ABM0JCL4_APLCA|nr:transmembrane protein 39A isoform X2 [Aplysia californica]
MPSGRRIFSRIQSGNAYSSSGKSGGSGGSHGPDDSSGNVVPLASMVVLPKHSYLPDIPMDSNLYFECMLFVFGIIMMCLQYINLYKTVWWLPQSHAQYALNFYLIDFYLVGFISILLATRFLVYFVQEIHSAKLLFWLMQGAKVVLSFCFIIGLGVTGYMVVSEHGIKTCLFLFYPVVIYLVLFGFAVKPLYQRYQAWPRPALSMDRQTSGPQRFKVRDDVPLGHACTLTPDIVRDEVDILKRDFNMRLKQILFNSLTTSFYATGVPVWFSQKNTLYYDSWWMWQHVCLTWLSALLMLTSHFLPPHYLHLLHKSARHLGRWQRMEARHAHVPYNAWSELQVWPQGALVKHVRGLFKAEGIIVTAEPGNSLHSRFYMLFHQPLRVMNWLVSLTGLVVGYQMFRLLQSSEWSHVISLALLMFCNFYTLFKLVRDWFIMGKVYKQHDYGITD